MGDRPLSATLLSTLAALAGSPITASVLGLAIGVGLLLLTKRASRMVLPEDPQLGMAKMLAVILGGLVGAVAVLTVLYLYARSSLAPFGLAMATGFLVLATYELFKFGGPAAVSGRRR